MSNGQPGRWCSTLRLHLCPTVDSTPFHVIAYLLVALTSSAGATNTIDQARESFGEVQSFIAELDGQPLISSNWNGYFRPYLYSAGRFVELIKSNLDEPLDLYSPTPISENRVILAGSLSGSPNFDLFLYDRDTNRLTNLTQTPQVDEGDQCIFKESARISYREGTRQRFARLEEEQLRQITAVEVPGFNKCMWLREDELYGARRQGTDKVQLYRCQVLDDRAQCSAMPVSIELSRFSNFFKSGDGRPGVLALRRDTEYRRPYVLSEGGRQLIPTLGNPPPGDILDFDEGFLRVGFHGHYQSTLVSDPATVVFTVRRIGNKYYAVAATRSVAKTLAELKDGRWFFHRRRKPGIDLAGFSVEEMQIPVSIDDKCPAFYFGPEKTSSAILWLHGGPRENVSPRFNPYFSHLNGNGHGVLALNYPGSVGWGAKYEDSFDEAHLAGCLRGAVELLRARRVKTIVAWSISTGSRLQRILLRHSIPISGMIDQAGFANGDLRAMADAQRLPYLSIRGDHDVNDEGSRIDFWYVGGHDVTHYQQFARLIERVDEFLGSLGRDQTPLIGSAVPSSK